MSPEKIKIHRLFLLIIVLSVIFCCNSAQAKERIKVLKFKAQQYYWGREVPQSLEKAFQLYMEAARRGDTEAQYIVGGMYFRGLGTEKNFSKAFEYLYGAAKLGESTPQSQKLLGEFFLIGHTTPQNYKKAIKWYEKASENGDRNAQAELGYFYYSGRGVEQDLKKSFFWFERAAYQNLPAAQYSLGIMWYSGYGVNTVDPITSYAWLNIAAANNYPNATIARDIIAQSLNVEEIEKAQEMASLLHNKIKK